MIVHSHIYWNQLEFVTPNLSQTILQYDRFAKVKAFVSYKAGKVQMNQKKRAE